MKNFSRKTLIWSGVGIVMVLLIGYGIFRPKASAYQFVTVEQKSIIETVSVTGNTVPTSSVALGFSTSGTITQVYSNVGEKVTEGQILSKLNTSDLNAQIKQAEANLAIQQAQGQNTTVNVDQVQKQQDTLVANAHHALLSNGLQAVPNDVTTIASAPIITGDYSGPEGDYEIHMYPAISQSGEAFYISGLESGFAEQAASYPVPLGTKGLYVQFPSGSLSQYGNTVWTVSIPNTKSAVYTANENAYLAAEANRDTAVANALAQVTSSTQGASVSQAQIQSAQAALQSAESKLQNSEIIAPISGVITQFDAKVGQFTSPGTPLISIISPNSFEVDALVSETDIGKISLKNKVTMTLDAFPNETFTGSVFYIDPAQTTTQGVVGYKIKIAFTTPDPRMKSGLTANLDISTREKDGVLALPQSAILQNDSGTFVEVVHNKTVTNMPVTLGLQDKNGNVEIVTGVTAGEQVLNVGLKQK